MARKNDIKVGSHLYGPDGYLGIAQGRPIGRAARYQLFAGQAVGLIDYADVEVGGDPPPKTLIKRALDHLIGSGQQFTADEVWPMLSIHANVSSKSNGGSLARQVQIYRDWGFIRSTAWRVTARSAAKSRAVPVWVKAGQARKVAA